MLHRETSLLLNITIIIPTVEFRLNLKPTYKMQLIVIFEDSN